jgi:hypothetical protein
MSSMEKLERNRLFVGIDPGKSGGIAYISENEGKVDYFKCQTAYDLNTMLSIFKGSFTPKNLHIYIEKVWSFPKDSAKASFSFGKNIGMWETLLEINELEYTEVAPRVWQKYLNIPSGLKKNERKKLLKKVANDYIRCYDTDSKAVTYYTADAICIAYYGKLKAS